MKIAFYGNVCNNFYTLAKALRNHLNIDAHLYLNHKADMQNRPESDDPHLINNYPSWIHLSDKWNTGPFLRTRNRRFIDELNTYDVVFLSQIGPVLAPYLKVKTVFYATGADLTQVPFPSKFSFLFKGITDRIKWEYIGLMQRKGIRRCTTIITQPFYPFANALKELKVKPSHISHGYFPILMDTDIIKCNESAANEIDPYNRELLSGFNFVLLHPTRINLNQSKPNLDSGQWKGNDTLFRAFALFIKKYNITDACIAMPDRAASPDISKAREMIGNLDIAKNIVWLKPPDPEGFPRKDLINFYSVADVVADEFAIGWFGSIVVEGMACSKPTFSYVDEAVMKQLYPWHPIISSKDPEILAELIATYYFDKDKRKKQGDLSRKWAVEFHSITKGTEIYIKNFQTDLRSIFNFN